MHHTESWRLLPLHIGSSSWHFALSDALARHVQSPTLWWHATREPTLILGPGQSRVLVDVGACERAGVLVIRRQAGGAAVYAADGVLGLDVALPDGHPLATADVVEAYHWLGEVWVEAVSELGGEAELVTVDQARRAAQQTRPFEDLIRLACFGSLSPYEVTVGGKKLVGLAQVRRRRNVLLQSGIHLRFDAGALAGLLAPTRAAELTAALESAGVGLEAAAPAEQPHKITDVIAAFGRSMRARMGIELALGAWADDELAHARRVELETLDSR